MTPERLTEIREWVQRHGPGNCWTGTTGTPAAMLRELLDELEQRPESVKPGPGQRDLFQESA